MFILFNRKISYQNRTNEQKGKKQFIKSACKKIIIFGFMFEEKVLLFKVCLENSFRHRKKKNTYLAEKINIKQK